VVQKKLPPTTKMTIPLKVALGNIFLIVNVFVWYIYASAILRDAVDNTSFTYFEKLCCDIVLFLSIVVSMLLSASLVSNLTRRKYFVLTWTFTGVLSSLGLMLLESATIGIMPFFIFLVGISFGLGLPLYMADFANITRTENRARWGSATILSMFFGTFALGFMMPTNLFLSALMLAAWRLLGLVILFIIKDPLEDVKIGKSYSLILLFKDRSVLLYLIPWTVFSMINYLVWPIGNKIQGENFATFSALLSNVIAGIFAPVAGFIADNFGRKRILILGFILFGIGYAVLGINPFNIYAWYFYTLIDGIAWGIFYVIFWFTIWGDLAHERTSEKYYAVGILPYVLSGFLRVTLGPFIVNTVSEYAIFSFAAFFLFLAVIPLMFAPETLPEKTLRERELRSYIERAKRIREKFTKGQ
jgi:MFS family permease